jgi:hypothetical protein
VGLERSQCCLIDNFVMKNCLHLHSPSCSSMPEIRVVVFSHFLLLLRMKTSRLEWDCWRWKRSGTGLAVADLRKHMLVSAADQGWMGRCS